MKPCWNIVDGKLLFDNRVLGDASRLIYAAGESLIAADPNATHATLAPRPSGDALFVKEGPNGPTVWGFERKTVDDLVNSYSTGHLADQIGRMVECYDVSVLLIEGRFAPVEAGRKFAGCVPSNAYARGKKPVAWATMQEHLFKLQAQYGVLLLNTLTIESSVAALHYLRVCDDYSATLARVPKQHQNILAAVPGIAPATAARLCAKYGSASGVVALATNASVWDKEDARPLKRIAEAFDV